MSDSLESSLARIEAKQDMTIETLKKLDKQTDIHWAKISEIETKLALLEQRQPPRVPVITWLVGLVALAGFVIAMFDRLYLSTMGQ